MDGTVVQTSHGRLRGTQEGGLVVFRGVPFAAPPIGPLRFQPAAPAASWTGERDAGRHGPAAPQNRSDLAHAMGELALETAEDCLTLTVWTPGCDGARRPLLLWLHGGAFISGAGSVPWYDGARLAAEGGMVVVTANYRLGALGWLRWPGAAPGNMGMSDQAAALRRVHVQACDIDPAGEDASDRLARPPIGAILRAQQAAERVGFSLPVRCQAWRPLLDAPATQAALLDRTADGLAGKDVLVGVTGAEGHAFLGGPLPRDATIDAVAARLEALAGTSAALPHYLASCPGATPGELLAEVVSDYQFVFAALGLADRVAKRSGNVHVYVFDWHPPGLRFGAGHCIDLPFCFGTLPAWRDSPMLAGADADVMAALSNVMRQALIGFVRDGAPAVAEPLAWPGYGESRTVLHVGDRLLAVPAAAGLLNRAPPNSAIW